MGFREPLIEDKIVLKLAKVTRKITKKFTTVVQLCAPLMSGGG